MMQDFQNAIIYVLVNLSLDQVDHIVFYEKPFLKFERLLETYIANAPRVFNLLEQQCQFGCAKNFSKIASYKDLKQVSNNFTADKLLFAEHHKVKLPVHSTPHHSKRP